MRQTPNYNLPQFDGTDFFNKEALNDAFNKIDTGISDIQETVNISSGDTGLVAREVIDARKGKTNLKEKIEEIDLEIQNNSSSLEQNTKYLQDIEISPLMFGAKGDGVTDDTQAFSNCIDYCIKNKKTMQITPSYTFAITSISKDIPSDNGFTMRGNGQQSKIKIINKTGNNGLTFTVSGKFRVVDIGNFEIIGNENCGNGLVVVRAVRPSRIYNIIGTEFTKSGTAPIKLIDCIDLQHMNCFSRKVANGLLLDGQCDRVDINKFTCYDWSEYGLSVTPNTETVTSLLENSICLSIYEPYFYGTGELTTDYTGKIAMNLVDCEKFSLYGGWFENTEYAIKGVSGVLNKGVPQCSIYNPKRGGNNIPKIYLEKSYNAFVNSPNLPIEYSAGTNGCVFVVNNKTSVEDNGLNTILSKDYNSFPNEVKIDGYISSSIKAEGLSKGFYTVNTGSVVNIPLSDTIGILMLSCTSQKDVNFIGQIRANASPYASTMTKSANVNVGVDLNLTGGTGESGCVTISINSNKSITIENRLTSNKSFKVTML